MGAAAYSTRSSTGSYEKPNREKARGSNDLGASKALARMIIGSMVMGGMALKSEATRVKVASRSCRRQHWRCLR